MSLHIPQSIQSSISKNPQACGIKNKDSLFMCANVHYIRIIGLEHPEDIVGRTDWDMPWATTACAHLFQAQDQQVIRSQKTLRILDIHPFADGAWKAYLFTKTPYINHEGHCDGTVFHGQEITQTSILEFGALLANTASYSGINPLLGQNSYLLGSLPTGSVNLTARQKEVLFFLIRGHSLKHIASTLQIAIATVGEHVDKLKEKFNATCKSELFERAIAHGFVSLIPDSLRIQQMSLALHECAD
jgi:DNA-binding CsgD family transcriptional regulator